MLLPRTVTCVLLLSVSPACAQQLAGVAVAADVNADKQSNTESGLYRRIFLPAAFIEQYVGDAESRWPIDRREFEQLVEEYGARIGEREYNGPMLDSIELSAQVSPTGVLSGEAKLYVVRSANSDSILALDPLNLAVSRAEWADNSQQIRLGQWQIDDGAAGSYGVLLPGSGVIRLLWSASPSMVRNEDAEYLLKLPPAVARQITLDLPGDMQAKVSPGRLMSVEDSLDQSSRRWVFQLGAGDCLLLLSSSPDLPKRPSVQATVNTSQEYKLGVNGLDYLAYVDVFPIRSVESLQASVQGKLEIVDVTVDGDSVEWTLDEALGRILQINIPVGREQQRIRISGVAAFPLGDEFSLPRIVPIDTLWTSGSMSVSLDSTLELRAIDTVNCEIVDQRVSQLALGLQRQIELAAITPQARLSLQVAAQQHGRTGQTATRVMIGPDDISAESHIIWSTANGTSRDLTVHLEADWEIESIEGDGIADWFIERRPDVSLVRIRNDRAPTSDSPALLIIRGRIPAGQSSGTFSVKRLDWIRPIDMTTSSRLLGVVGSAESAVSPSVALNTAIREMSDIEATSSFPELFNEGFAGVTVDLHSAPPEAAVNVSPQPARYEAEAWCETTLLESQSTKRILIAANILTGAVSEFFLACSEPIPLEADLRILDSNATPDISPIDQWTESLPGSTQDGYLYLVRLPAQVSGSVALELTYAVDTKNSMPLHTVTIPDAASNVSWIIARGDPKAFRVDPGDAQVAAPTPAPETAAHAPPILGAFRLVQRAAPSATQPPIALARANGSGNDSARNAYISQCVAISRVHSDGMREVRIEYVVVGNGDVLQLEFPVEPTFKSVYIDEQPALNSITKRSSKSLRLTIPTHPRTSNVVLEYYFQYRPLGIMSTVEAHLPTCSMDILNGRWTVIAPARYERVDWSEPMQANAFGQPNDSTWSTSDGSIARAPTIPSQTAANADGAAWRTVTTTFVDNPDGMLMALSGVLDAVWWAIWFLGSGAGYFLLPNKGKALLLLSALTGIVYFVGPQSASTYSAAILAGIASGVVTLWIQESRMLHLRHSGQVAAVTLAFLTSCQGDVVAQVIAEAAPPAVLFPVDTELKPAGDDVYVPESLLRTLLSALRPEPNGGAAGVLVDARVDLALSRLPAGAQVEIESCALVLRFETFRPNARIRFELDRRQLSSTTDEPLSSDRTWTIDWIDGENACEITIAQVGRHAVRLPLQPNVSRNRGDATLSLQLPALPAAVVSIDASGAINQLEANGRRITPSDSRRDARIEAPCPTGELVVRWQEPVIKTDFAGDAAETLTLVLADDDVTLEHVVQLPESAADLGSVQIETSPNLQLLPTPLDSNVEEIESFSDGGSRATVRFRHDAVGPVTFKILFRPMRESPFGVVRLPKCKLVGFQEVDRRFAVRLSGDLQVQIEAEEGMKRLSLEDEAAIEPSSEPVDLAYEIEADLPHWSALVAPTSPRLSVRKRIRTACEAATAKITLEAECREQNRPRWMHIIDVPKDFSLTNLTAVEIAAKEPIPLTYSRSASSRITVFFDESVAVSHLLRLEGEQKMVSGVMSTPRFSFTDATEQDSELVLLRTGAVVLSWTNEEAAPTRLSNTEVEPTDSLRIVGRYELPPTGVPVSTISVAPNRPAYDAASVITIASREPDDVKFYVAGRVTSGILDSMLISAPQSWQPDLATAAPGSVVPAGKASHQDRRYYEVLLPEQIETNEEFSVRLSGRIAAKAGRTSDIPDLRIEDAETHKRYAALAGFESRTRWELRGLAVTAPPTSLESMLVEAGGLVQCYRIVNDSFGAVRRNPAMTPSKAFIPLARAVAVVTKDLHLSCRCELTIQPGAADSCQVRTPRGSRILELFPSSGASIATAIDERTWQIPLAPSYMPQIITLVYTTTVTDDSELSCKLPIITARGRQLPIGKAIWQVEDKLPLSRPDASGVRELSPAQATSIAVESNFETLSSARDSYVHVTASEGDAWLHDWMLLVERDLNAAQLPDSQAREMWQQWDQLLASFPQSTLLAADDQEVDGYSASLISGLTGRGAYWITDRVDGMLQLRRAHHETNPIGRILGALGVLLTAVVVWRFRAELSPIASKCSRNPVAAGLAAASLLWVVFHSTALCIAALLATATLLVRPKTANPPANDVQSSAGGLIVQVE